MISPHGLWVNATNIRPFDLGENGSAPSAALDPTTAEFAPAIDGPALLS
jgi:hypothetical protein